jgi:alpha-N-arabinofuranosidase
MLHRVTVRLDDQPGAAISPHLFGALTEHFGRGMYGGIWDTERDIPRADVKAAAAAAGYTMFRYPGGCFSDWYHWRDGIGPKAGRPSHPETYWTGFRFDTLMPAGLGERFALPAEISRQFGPPETNQVGTAEFLKYCADLDVEPMLIANFGTGDPAEAADWVRYTNRSGRTARPVTWWGVGNETYGQWELGHCTAAEYAARYNEYARLMRGVDPSIRLVAVGCGDPDSGAEGRNWNQQVVTDAGDNIDALSVHWYYPGSWVGRPLRDDQNDYLQVAAGPDALGRMLDRVRADLIAARGPDHGITLSLDEWNLWVELTDLLTTNARLCDAVFFAGCFNRMIERADLVRIAMISHLVNCMAPIQTRGDRHFVTSSYLVHALYRKFVRARQVGVHVETGELAVPPFDEALISSAEMSSMVGLTGDPEGTTTSMFDASASRDDTGTTVFVVNKHFEAAADIDVVGLPPGAAVRLRLLTGPSPFAANDEDHPDQLGFVDLHFTVLPNGSVRFLLPTATVGALVVDPA